MKEWFLKLEPRERRIFLIGAAVAAVIVLWGLVWRPLSTGADELRESVGEKTRLLADLRRAVALTPAADAGADPAAAGESLITLVDSTAQSSGLSRSFTRTRPDGADAISVSFQNAPFDDIVGWLVTLERSYGISVESASFSGARDAGLVSGQLFLRRM